MAWANRTGLRGSRLEVLVQIAYGADETGQHACRTNTEIAAATGLSIRSVRNVIAQLRREGWVQPTSDDRGGRGLGTEYRLGGFAEKAEGTRQAQVAETRKKVGENPAETRKNEEPSLFVVQTDRQTGRVAPKERARDLVFEAVIEACGWDLTTLTKSERGRANAAAKELRDVRAEADEIHLRAVAWGRRYPDIPLSPQALAGNWSALAEKRRTLLKAVGSDVATDSCGLCFAIPSSRCSSPRCPYPQEVR